MVVKINFIGDIGLFKQYEILSIDPLKDVFLPASDYNIANLEFMVPLYKNKQFYDVNEKYSCSYEYFKQLELRRFDAYSLANNHVMDYGPQGVRDTIAVLKDKGCTAFGINFDSNYNIHTFELNNISFCIIGCVNKGRATSVSKDVTPNAYDEDQILRLINLYRNKVDHILLFPHWNTEMVDIPIPENVKRAHRFVEAGTRVIAGHHPHVSQGIENYGGSIIAYSLGSFIYIPEEEIGYRPNQFPMRNISICLTVTFNKEAVIDYSCLYYRYHKQSKLPIPVQMIDIQEYVDFLNKNIGNSSLHYSRRKEILLKREFFSFIDRFKISPSKTFLHYLKYISGKFFRM